jgi:pilus assembly protein CpaB
MADGVGNGKGASRWVVRAALFLALALVAAGGAALLLTRWVNQRIALARVPTEKVVVATVDLPVGTRLTSDQLEAVDWPMATRPSSATADPAPLAGQIVATHIFKGEAVLPDKLVSGTVGGLAALLPEGGRAISVRVDDVVGVAGFIHPGDLVDVIVTMRADDSIGVPFTSKIILQGIKVLAVGKEVDARARQGDKVLPATVATLQVDSAQAEMLALAATKGQLLLALRSSTDTGEVATTGVVPRTLLAAVEPPAPPKSAEPAPAPAPAPATARRRAPAPRPAVQPSQPEPRADKKVVEILRGDLFERRNFDKKEETP